MERGEKVVQEENESCLESCSLLFLSARSPDGLRCCFPTPAFSVLCKASSAAFPKLDPACFHFSCVSLELSGLLFLLKVATGGLLLFQGGIFCKVTLLHSMIFFSFQKEWISKSREITNVIRNHCLVQRLLPYDRSSGLDSEIDLAGLCNKTACGQKHGLWKDLEFFSETTTAN